MDPASTQFLYSILLCDLYEETVIRSLIPKGSEIFKRIRQNQNERYHCFDESVIVTTDGQDTGRSLPALFMDFKKTFSLPTDQVYASLVAGELDRQAVVPPIFVHDLMHRAFGFMSRVGVPTPEEEQRRAAAELPPPE